MFNLAVLTTLAVVASHIASCCSGIYHRTAMIAKLNEFY